MPYKKEQIEQEGNNKSKILVPAVAGVVKALEEP